MRHLFKDRGRWFVSKKKIKVKEYYHHNSVILSYRHNQGAFCHEKSTTPYKFRFMIFSVSQSFNPHWFAFYNWNEISEVRTGDRVVRNDGRLARCVHRGRGRGQTLDARWARCFPDWDAARRWGVGDGQVALGLPGGRGRRCPSIVQAKNKVTLTSS